MRIVIAGGRDFGNYDLRDGSSETRSMIGLGTNMELTVRVVRY